MAFTIKNSKRFGVVDTPHTKMMGKIGINVVNQWCLIGLSPITSEIELWHPKLT
jgi:hypothetical protein